MVVLIKKNEVAGAVENQTQKQPEQVKLTKRADGRFFKLLGLLAAKALAHLLTYLIREEGAWAGPILR